MMKPLTIVEEWEEGALRVRLTVCDGIRPTCRATERILVGERERPETDWVCAAYVPRGCEHDDEIRGDLSEPHIQDTLLHAIALVGTSWPLDCVTADETAQALDAAPEWMMNVPTDQVRRVREWCWGVDWVKVPAALIDMRYCITPFDRPVKKGGLS